MLPRITPITPARIQAPFDDADFVWELKHDGFRAVVYIEDGSCRLISRKQIPYTSFAVAGNSSTSSGPEHRMR
jgi:ATP-dependent DNA ligase